MAPGLGHISLPGAQIPFKANMSEQGSSPPPRRQGSGLRLKSREAQSWLHQGVFRKALRLEGAA